MNGRLSPVTLYACTGSAENRSRKSEKTDQAFRKSAWDIPQPPAAPPAEIFVSTSGSGPHQSGPNRILMILWRKSSFSGIGGAHHRRACPACGQPAEAASWPGGACPVAGPPLLDCGCSWPDATAFGPEGVFAAGLALPLAGALGLLPSDVHPDAFPGVWDTHAEQRNKLAPASMDRAVTCFKKVLMEAPIFSPSGK